jgi:mitotic spindle assembly checkpoint protein MAD1
LQVFVSKSAEFREAITSIIGLKPTLDPNGQVRDLSASFVFQPASKTAGGKIPFVAQQEAAADAVLDRGGVYFGIHG